uniref:Uncharacterized protein n=1 Tax=Xenopus tropicalis TaxID=8364 RepID=A0A1B8YAV0_XENTR
MKAVWAPGLNTTSMGPLLPLSVCLVLPLAAACCTGYTSDPAVGSMAGGTWIMIRFNSE